MVLFNGSACSRNELKMLHAGENYGDGARQISLTGSWKGKKKKYIYIYAKLISMPGNWNWNSVKFRLTVNKTARVASASLVDAEVWVKGFGPWVWSRISGGFGSGSASTKCNSFGATADAIGRHFVAATLNGMGLRVQRGNEQVFFTPKHFFPLQVLGKKLSSLFEWRCCKFQCWPWPMNPPKWVQ